MKNSLAKIHPELVEQWSSRNHPLMPEQISYGSNKKVWWRGSCGHEWEASVKNRVNGSGCPFCSHNAILEGFNDLASQYPKLAQEWAEENLPLFPQQVMVFSNRKVWWRCQAGHRWEARVSDRSNGSGCPYCTGKILLKGFNDFATRQPELVKEWSERNLPLTPDQISEKSRQNVWWKCSECGYEWKAMIWSRVKGCSCPACADRVVLAGYNDLATTNRELMAEWDEEKNAEIRPEQISGKSMRIVWWKCSHGHRWRGKIAERACEGKTCSVCEAEYRAVFPQLAVAYYARKRQLSAVFNTDEEIGLILDAYIAEERLAFLWGKRGLDYERTREYSCRTRGIKLIRLNTKASTVDMAVEIKKAFQSVHVFIASDVSEDERNIRMMYEKWRNKR